MVDLQAINGYIMKIPALSPMAQTRDLLFGDKDQLVFIQCFYCGLNK